MHLCASFCLFNLLCRGFYFNATSNDCIELDEGLDLKQSTPEEGTMIVVDFSVITGNGCLNSVDTLLIVMTSEPLDQRPNLVREAVIKHVLLALKIINVCQ